MALKLDKDSLLEFLGKNKDQLFLAVLVVAAAYGGWYLYSSSSRPADQIIKDYIQDSPGGVDEEERITSTEVADKLTAKVEEAKFELEANPFGSPEAQLRVRQEIENYYRQGVDMLNAQRYQEAIAMFDRVIELDVTESRIRYPVSPSEYKRRAQSLDATQNFDRILNTAQTEAAEGDRLAGAGQQRDALVPYERASKLVSDVLDSSPDLADTQLDQLRQIQTTVDQKLRNIQKTIIIQEVNKAAQEANSVLQSNDLVKHILASSTLAQIQVQINSIDPNAQLIDQSVRGNVSSLLQRLQGKLKDSLPMIISQAETQFNTAIQAKDEIKAQQAIFALTQALNYVQQSQDTSARQDIMTKRNNFISMRAQLVVEKAQAFYQEQNQILTQNNYDQFDQTGKIRYLKELNQLLDAGKAIDANMQQTIQTLMSQINALKLPPPVTEKYEILEIKLASSTSNTYSVKYVDKQGRSQKARNATWREGLEDRQTKITMKVDTDRGVVILSSPGYTDAEVPLTVEQ